MRCGGVRPPWTDLGQSRFVDAVDVGLGTRLDLAGEGLVTCGAVEQRLNTRTHRYRRRVTTRSSQHAAPPGGDHSCSTGLGGVMAASAVLTLSFLKGQSLVSTVPLGHAVAFR